MQKIEKCTQAILLALMLPCLSSCGAYERYQRTKQIESYAHLQAAASIINELIAQKGIIEKERAEEIVKTINRGRDAWGSKILYEQRSRPDFSFLLISLGRDRVLDVRNVEEYFVHPEEDVRGDFDRDIVFRDGIPVTFSGK